MDKLIEIFNIPYTLSQTKLSRFLYLFHGRNRLPFSGFVFIQLDDIRILSQYFYEFSLFLAEVDQYYVVPVSLRAFFEKPFMLNVNWGDVSPECIDQRDVENSLLLLHCQIKPLEGEVKETRPYYVIQDDGHGSLAVMSLAKPQEEPSRIFLLPDNELVEKEFIW
jgi:hypothetical protein